MHLSRSHSEIVRPSVAISRSQRMETVSSPPSSSNPIETWPDRAVGRAVGPLTRGSRRRPFIKFSKVNLGRQRGYGWGVLSPSDGRSRYRKSEIGNVRHFSFWNLAFKYGRRHCMYVLEVNGAIIAVFLSVKREFVARMGTRQLSVGTSSKRRNY